MERHSYLGVGLYTMPEAARILGVPAPKLRRWARGYRHGQSRFSEPLFEHDFPELVQGGILTFLDLMEMYLVVQFLVAGMSMRRIRAAAKRASEQFNTHYPFATPKVPHGWSADLRRDRSAVRRVHVSAWRHERADLGSGRRRRRPGVPANRDRNVRRGSRAASRVEFAVAVRLPRRSWFLAVLVQR